MATIRKRTGKYGISFYAELMVKGRRVYKSFDRKSEAVQWTEETEYLLRNDLPLPR